MFFFIYFLDQDVEAMKSCSCDVCFIYFIDQGVETMKSCSCDVCFIYFIDQGMEAMKSCSCDVCFIYFIDQGVETMKSCGCDVPCTRFIYDATISYSLLDTIRMKDEIWSHEKSRELLPNYRDALDLSPQVRIKKHHPSSASLDKNNGT